MFSFKQFTIHQDRTAMKVCTDACVLGAYADVGVGGRILDIGTGTGLLALMAAQRNPTARVDAVEVDDAAFEQAVANVSNTRIGERVRVWHGRVQDFMLSPTPDFAPVLGDGSEATQSTSLSQNGREVGGRYDRILTNPPFYTNQLRSPDAAVNRALHADELPFDKLVEAVARLLKPDGQWWVLLPPYEAGKLAQLAQIVGLRPFQRLYLHHHARKPAFRVVTGFQFGQPAVTDETLAIYETDGQTYTPAFRALLVDFYLIF